MASVTQITVDNQSFPNFRTAMNSSLSALNTLSSASSAPDSKAAGSLWLDTTSATTPTLKFYDGSDWISLCTFNYSANTVNWLDSTVSLGADSVDSDQYVDGSIDNVHLADNAVDTEEIADNAVSLAKMAGGTDGNIISYDASGDPVAIATGTDGQVLTSAGAGAPPAFETLSSGGITEIDQWQTSSSQVGTTAFICGNWARSWQTQLGTGMTESSGIFTFPSTGWWRLEAQAVFYKGSQSDWVSTILYITTNTEGSWDYPSYGSSHTYTDSSSYSGSYCSFIFDVTNISSHKCKLVLEAQQSTAWVGHVNNINTAMKFTKLAET